MVVCRLERTRKTKWRTAAEGRAKPAGFGGVLARLGNFGRDKGNKIVEVKNDRFKDESTVHVTAKVPNYEHGKPLEIQFRISSVGTI